MRFEVGFFALFSMGYFLGIRSDDNIQIVVLVGNKQRDLIMSFANTIKNYEYSERVGNAKITDHYIEINRMEPNRSIDKLCGMFYNGISIILDLTSFDWKEGRNLISATETIYLKLKSLLEPFFAASDEIVQRRSGNDLVLILQSDQEVQASLWYIIDKSNLRVLPLNGFASDLMDRLESLRPTPRYYSIFAYTKNMKKIYETISQSKLFKQSDKWHLVFLDADVKEFDSTAIPNNVTIIKPNENDLGHLSFKEKIFFELLDKIQEANRVQKISQQKFDCNNFTTEYISKDLDSKEKKFLFQSIKSSQILKVDDDTISYNLNLSIEKTENGKLIQVGTWTDGVFKAVASQSLQPAKRFFRIGTTEAIPWTYFKRDPDTQETLIDDTGNPIWEGYCIDLIAKLSEKMGFDYEIVTPRKGTFGSRNANGTWDGLVGDLTIGETDIAVAALKMTAEREEVIDYVAPYFEQTGISIVIRKPFRQTSLFKFMTVLRLEVWLSIVAALVATAIMIWFMDKYSPYSSRNNPAAYPYPCRDFSLKESFWFALTSFTPQGGGEVPKSISARTLVAAYWLFVVLMLATFTANLAAFLTVERMQTPVQSLEQLARQSRINYTVVEGSNTHKYFINMKFAEDTLYRLWKELTLNATSDQSQYRIWDYPIKEQYGHILLAINSSNPVKDAEEGFRQVSAHENADFAFIHDSAEIKYEVSKNCNLTEIGEVFAEQPYAIAVQQGSHLQDELTYAILELQKDRYFEMLTAKYWNNSAKKHCDSVDESEGITLESIGGVFIATLFGLGLAMITLAFEVLYYKRKELRIIQVKPLEENDRTLKKSNKQSNKQKLPSYDEAQRSDSTFGGVTLSKEFVPARKRNTKITFIKPRDSIHGPFYYE